jgi:NAD+ synthase (glutamine-hydrolysing)
VNYWNNASVPPPAVSGRPDSGDSSPSMPGVYSRDMRIALAQINPTVGDLVANEKKIVDFLTRAKAAGARLVVFPELGVVGYPPKDLLLKPGFIADNLAAVERIAAHAVGITAIVGYVDRNAQSVGRTLYNAAAVMTEGRIVSRHFKTLLPTYDVFDESRYFEPYTDGARSQIVDIDGIQVGISICEDLWNDERILSRRLYHQNPIAQLDAAGAQIMINISASPFVIEKHDIRIKLASAAATQFDNPFLYVNQVGGNDELVFDGNSFVVDATGKVIAHAKAFAEDLLVVDVPLSRSMSVPLMPSNPALPPTREPLWSIHQALVLGLRDYARKCGFKSVVLGLSGGIDSALVCAIAAEALGPKNVVGVAMPSRYSSDHSIADAKALAENLGIEFHLVPIKDIHDAFENGVTPHFAGRAPDITEENLQARTRGAILMAFSNKFNHLLLTTGNKSEVAVGYCTLYGDMCGGLAVISDVPKTTVWELSRWINKNAGREIIPTNSIEKPPSAELRPGQLDQDSLPPYPILDQIIERYVEDERSAAEIIADGFDEATVRRVIKLIDRSEYKRRQAAPGLKVTSRAFGFGRRMPIAQNYASW